ncbi:MAG TPA: propionate catabolism operon regulatory protein PrpR [Rhodocyclaceae bacterium]|nr:propionate catabolism operon regulatory protein PrpR [Rhodocyclaceae bacterium]
MNPATLPSSPGRLPRLCVLSFSRLSQLLESVAVDYANRVELVVENRRFGDALAQAQALIARGDVDVFISAGANGAQLRRQLDHPVVLISPSGFDIMAALVQAARLGSRIGLVTYEAVASELGELSQLLRIELHLRRYTNEHDVEEQVVDLHARGVEVVIGPSLVVETAERCGMDAVFLYSPESARRALDEAIEVARVRAVEHKRRQQLAAILAKLREGVLAVERDGHVWFANPAMGELLARPAASMQGQPLAAVLPELAQDATLAQVFAPGGGALTGKVFFVGTRRLIANIAPMDDADMRGMAVLTAQDASAIERAGRDLRMHAARSGNSLRARHTLDDLVGESEAMQALRTLAARFAVIDLSLLIFGESGTGKELVAQGIHSASPRSREPFVAINCAAMPENLLESELFGYEEGAFTGAAKGGKAGLLETAHRGTVFLDEVGDMPTALQVRLLRVLQEREVLRVGGREPIPIDLRIIAATHRDLAACVAQGSFRQDLYYRLNGLRLSVPALRERTADLPGLIATIVARRHKRSGLQAPEETLLKRFLAAAQGYAWPGNVRELENMIERLMAVSASSTEDGPLIELLFPEFTVRHSEPAAGEALRDVVREAQRNRLEAALREASGNMQRAAMALGISRTTLWRRMRESESR